MLIHLIPDKVAKCWDFFAEVLGESLSPRLSQSQGGMTKILESILMERLHVWVYETDGSSIFIITTTFEIDQVTHEKKLLIYSMTSLRNITPEIWKDAYSTLKKFADSRGAQSVVAYTKDPKIIDYIKKTGGSAEYTLLELSA